MKTLKTMFNKYSDKEHALSDLEERVFYACTATTSYLSARDIPPVKVGFSPEDIHSVMKRGKEVGAHAMKVTVYKKRTEELSSQKISNYGIRRNSHEVLKLFSSKEECWEYYIDCHRKSFDSYKVVVPEGLTEIVKEPILKGRIHKDENLEKLLNKDSFVSCFSPRLTMSGRKGRLSNQNIKREEDKTPEITSFFCYCANNHENTLAHYALFVPRVHFYEDETDARIYFNNEIDRQKDYIGEFILDHGSFSSYDFEKYVESKIGS